MKVYFKTEKIDNTTFYGYNIYMNEQMVDSLYGVINDSNENTLNKITKNMLIKNKSVLKYDKLLTLKYDKLEDAKYMAYMINHDKFYEDIKNDSVLMTSPSIFLSDNNAKHKLEMGLNKYKMMYNYYAKTLKQR